MTVRSWPIVSPLEIEIPLDAMQLQPYGLCSYTVYGSGRGKRLIGRSADVAELRALENRQ